MNTNFKIKFPVFLFLLGTFSLSVYATDFSLCQNFISKTNENIMKTGFHFPFKISKNGNIEITNKKINHHPHSALKNTHVFSYSQHPRKFDISVFTKNEKSVPNKIEILITNNQGPLLGTVQTIKFKYSNDKCYPEIAHSKFAIRGQKIKSTIFDTKFCKNIKDFFEKNKSLDRCFNVTSPANKAISELFKQNGYDINELVGKFATITPFMNQYNFSVEQKILSSSSNIFSPFTFGNKKANKTTLGALGSSPVISAYMILHDCYEKGLSSSIEDKTIWKTNNNNTTGSEIPTGNPL